MRNTVPRNAAKTASINFDDKKVKYNGLKYFAHVFISDHITIYNRFYLLTLHKIKVKTKTY